ncbi:MAG: hypothetical protein R8G66_24020 [Cytophagales bacterium]|nr:hypothetical protein [Cytophagales bacterium]
MISACRHQYNREIIIDDVSKARTDTIGFKLASHESISHLSLSIKGNLNGKSLIDEMQLSPGKIDTVFIMECDSSSYILRYMPIGATEGILQINLELATEVNF